MYHVEGEMYHVWLHLATAKRIKIHVHCVLSRQIFFENNLTQHYDRPAHLAIGIFQSLKKRIYEGKRVKK
jgi:hypothetical protein